MTAAIALALVLAGLGYTFGIRSYLARKATGDTGLRTGTGPAGSVSWWAKLLFVASILLLIAGPAVALTGPGGLVRPVTGTIHAAGAAVAILGMLIVVAAQHRMGASWRIGVDQREVTGLVTGGLFAVARNPIFTGMIVFAAGIAVMIPNALSAAAVVVLLAAVQMQVRLIEEPYLLAGHGDAYRRYAVRTGRFLPIVGRLSDHDRHDRVHRDGHDQHDHDGHDHARHGHGIGQDADRRWLALALTAITAFIAVEVAAGILADSLALISDAAHMLTDAAAIASALLAMRLAARPAQGSYTYGLKRAEILSAQLNGLSLLLLAGWLAYEAAHRLISPPQVTGWIVILTGVIGLLVNVIAAWAIGKANRASLNIEGAYQHVLMDALASLAAIAAGAVVALTGFYQADPIATLIVVALMIKAGWRLLRDSTRILLDAAPAGLPPDTVARRLLDLPDVLEIHDLHLWQITSGQPALSAHVLVAQTADCHRARAGLEALLADDFRIHHATLQVDHRSAHDRQAVTATHCAEPHGVTHRR